MDTIFATSSGSPPAAIAIIRISGAEALSSARALAGTIPPFRVARVRALRDPGDGQLLDRALVLAFDAPRTATGEDLVEFHVHGGRAVVAAVEGALSRLPALRRATPGEFTRRALVNGVIDLTEAEGLGDLLAAETEGQRRAALRVAEGGLRHLIEGWMTELVGLAARIEAQLDFAEESDVTAEASGPLSIELKVLSDRIATVLMEPPVERLRDGVRIVLAGPPNSGKSTLLNRLADRDVAIVSPIAGTTRDRIEVPLVRNGIAYVMTDTAGLAEHSDDPIEAIGMERAEAAMEGADLILWLGDTPPPRGYALWLYPRVDAQNRAAPGDIDRYSVSARTGAGLDRLWSAIEARATSMVPSIDGVATNQRQRELLTAASAALQRASRSTDLILAAEEVRVALQSFDKITGRAGLQSVLDALFSKFCLGK